MGDPDPAIDVVLVGDHPASHGGFATVGREVARALHTRGVRVRYLVRGPARGPGGNQPPTGPYEVLEVDLADRSRSLSDVLDEVLGADAGRADADRVVLLSIGGSRDHDELLTALDRTRSRRSAAVIVYLAVDAVPLSPLTRHAVDRADVVVPYTAFGARAIQRAGVTASVAPPIPHGVDTDIFTPLAPEDRDAVRRDHFGLADDELLVGFFGRNCGHKRPDLALRIFAAWCNGGVARCPGCAALIELPSDPLAGRDDRLQRCPHCGGGGPFARQAASSRVRLYLHTELLTARQRRVSGGWDLELLARRLGVADRVSFDPTLQVGRGVDDRELARRMAACDVHLLPYEGGAWELTVLETGACGVPNVITDAAAPPEYAAPFSELVAPMMWVHGPRGARAWIDVGAAVAALQRLLVNRGERQRLAEHGVEVARAHRWDRIGDAWLELLKEAARRGDHGVAGGGSAAGHPPLPCREASGRSEQERG